MTEAGCNIGFKCGLMLVYCIFVNYMFYLVVSFLGSANLCLNRKAATASATYTHTQTKIFVSD